jgi:magnesium-transporting ATPase (P-type)
LGERASKRPTVLLPLTGQAAMLVIAVGGSSFSGKIRAQVYGENPAEEEPSPLFKKLDKLAIDIGKVGMLVAGLCLSMMCIIGFGVKGLAAKDHILDYIITSITILVVAVPEGECFQDSHHDFLSFKD